MASKGEYYKEIHGQWCIMQVRRGIPTVVCSGMYESDADTILTALTAQADAEPCQHEVASRLTDRGEYGSEALTDWTWCCTCGAVSSRPGTWSKPANGTTTP